MAYKPDLKKRILCDWSCGEVFLVVKHGNTIYHSERSCQEYNANLSSSKSYLHHSWSMALAFICSCFCFRLGLCFSFGCSLCFLLLSQMHGMKRVPIGKKGFGVQTLRLKTQKPIKFSLFHDLNIAILYSPQLQHCQKAES